MDSDKIVFTYVHLCFVWAPVHWSVCFHEWFKKKKKKMEEYQSEIEREIPISLKEQ